MKTCYIEKLVLGMAPSYAMRKRIYETNAIKDKCMKKEICIKDEGSGVCLFFQFLSDDELESLKCCLSES